LGRGEFLAVLWPALFPLLVLLLATAFFSAAETAFFSLQGETITSLRESKSRKARLVAALMDAQRDFLATILLGGMVTSTLFYAGVSLVTYRVVEEGRGTLAGIIAVAGLVAAIVLGEIIPKAIALTFNRTVALAMSAPLYGVFRALEPVTRAVGPLVRALTAAGLRLTPASRRISREELSMLVDTTQSQGHMAPHEGEMIEEVMNLGQTRVREIMVPRVDIVALEKSAGVSDLVEAFRKTRRTKIPVYDGDIDHIIGVAHLKNALLAAPGTLSDVTGPAHYVPEFKTAENLLYEFREKRFTVAIVVDEYGGTAGIVTLADVAGEIVGPLGDEYEAPEKPVEEVSPGRYRMAGDISIRDWQELFNVDIGHERLSTLGGFLVLLLGRIPRVGDTVTYRNIRFTIEDVRKHRIVSVIAGLESEEEGGRQR
jgi:putative hemolysin